MSEMMERRQEHEPQKEYTSREVLHFFRHDEKEKNAAIPDEAVRLTPAGRRHAHELANPDTNIGQSIAFGSPRDRAQETAAHIMAGGAEEITGEETLEELKAKLDSELQVGSKIGSDRRLDFTAKKGTVVGDALQNSYKEKRMLEWVVQDSDRLARENNDRENSTYSRSAKAIAEIVGKYITIAPSWNRLVESGEYPDNTLERFLASHQSVIESFLAKVIEVVKGVEERDHFVNALNKEGFAPGEGFNAEIVTREADQPVLRVTFHRENPEKADDDPAKVFLFDEEVPLDVIERLVDA